MRVSATARSPLGRLSGKSDRLVWLALAALMLIAAAEILHDGRGTSFFEDEWDWVQWRRGWDAGAFLQPHVQHLVAVPVAIFKVLFATFGLESYAPYRVAALLAHLVVSLLVFLIARRYLAQWLALAATALVLFLGTGWADVLWAVNLDRSIATACALGIVLLIDRRDRAGTVGVAALLTLALASASVGIAVAIGVAAALAAERPFVRRRLWIVAVPVALYAVWYAKYGVAPPHHDFSSIPNYAANAAGGATGALFGMDLNWGRILAALLAIVVVRRLLAAERITPRVAMVLAVPLSFWALTAVARAYLNEPAASRYVYVGGTLVLVMAVVVLTPRVTTRRAAVLVAGFTVLAVIANVGAFRAGGDGRRADVAKVSSELGAVEIARDHVPPEFRPEVRHAPTLTAAGYLAAVDDLGSPAWSENEIATAPEPERIAADATLAAAEQVAPTSSGAPAATGACTSSAAGAPLDATVPAGGLVVTATAPARIAMRRFAATFQPLPSGAVNASTPTLLRPPADRSQVPWQVRLTSAGSVKTCPG